MKVDGPTSWRYLRSMRSDPPGRASSGARRKTFSAALQQGEELWQAAASVSPAVSPLTLFYGLSQAGRAIAAAQIEAKDTWQTVPGHGLILPKPEIAVETLPSLNDVYVFDNGDAYFQQITRLLGSPSLQKPGASIAALCCSLPEPEQWEDTWSLVRPLRISTSQGGPGAFVNLPAVEARVSPVPEHLIPESEYATPHEPEHLPILEDVISLLQPYPTLLLPNPPTKVSGAQRLIPGITRAAGVTLSWNVEEELSFGDRKLWCMNHLMSYSEPYVGNWPESGWALPAIGNNHAPMHPLATWWAILYGMSMLARYHPRIWTMLLDLDRSREAVAVHSILDAARDEVPYLLLRQLGGF